MADCRQFDTLVMDWLYGELDAAGRQEFEAHLEACSKCRQAAEELQDTRSLLASADLTAFEVEPPARISDTLMAAAARGAAEMSPRTGAATDGEKKPSLGKRLWAWLTPVMRHPALAAACALVIVAGAAVSLYRAGEPLPSPMASEAVAKDEATFGGDRAPSQAATQADKEEARAAASVAPMAPMVPMVQQNAAVGPPAGVAGANRTRSAQPASPPASKTTAEPSALADGFDLDDSNDFSDLGDLGATEQRAQQYDYRPSEPLAEKGDSAATLNLSKASSSRTRRPAKAANKQAKKRAAAAEDEVAELLEGGLVADKKARASGKSISTRGSGRSSGAANRGIRRDAPAPEPAEMAKEDAAEYIIDDDDGVARDAPRAPSQRSRQERAAGRVSNVPGSASAPAGGGSVGGVFAEPPPPPAPRRSRRRAAPAADQAAGEAPSAAREADAEAPESVVVTGSAPSSARKNTEVVPLARLLTDLERALRRDDCRRAVVLASTIAVRDAKLYRQDISRDRRLTRCQEKENARKRRSKSKK